MSDVNHDLLEAAKALLTFTKVAVDRLGLVDTHGIVAASEAIIAEAEARVTASNTRTDMLNDFRHETWGVGLDEEDKPPR